jgi:hypothetical protein
LINNGFRYIEMAKSAQEILRRNDFIYPLNCVFKVRGFDETLNVYMVLYERKITIQTGALNDGLKLHISPGPTLR